MGEKSVVAVLMGSQNDYEKVEPGVKILKEFNIPFEVRILSAHRTPEQTKEFVLSAEENGVKVFICAAGMAAHLAGVVASYTVRPVIGIPIAAGPLNGLDALYSTVMMPPGIPVATVAINGAQNAVYLALAILQDDVRGLSAQLKTARKQMAEKVIWADKNFKIG
jgi:5-(carboxyamino)imidazole ribonucleotide mutase